MIKLALAELRDGWRTWVGAFGVIVVASALLGACTTIAATWLAMGSGSSDSSGLSDVLLQLTSMIPGLCGVAAIVVLNSVASVAVQEGRERYARWQLIGITPAGVRGVLALQLAALGLLGGVVGLLVAIALARPTIGLVAQAVGAATGSTAPVHASLSAGLLLLAWLIVLAIVLLGGLTPARRASNASPMEVLRNPEDAQRKMTATRWIVVGVCGTATIALLASTFGNSMDIISLNTIFACILASAMLAAAAPIMLPPIIRLWPRIVPQRLSVTWYLARTSAEHRLQYSAASVTPLMVGITLIGAIYSAAYTQRNAMLAGDIPVERMHLATDQVIIMLGGPLILAVIGSAAIVFQGTRGRIRSASTLSRMGLQQAAIVSTAVLEAVVYAGTALITGLLIILIIVSIESLALIGAAGRAWPTVTMMPILTVTLVGLAVTALASVLPLASTRGIRSIRRRRF